VTDGPRELHLEVRGLNKHFGGLQAATDLSMRAQHGEVHAVIGPNGAGKTTLVHMLSGFLRPDSGSIVFGGEDITALSAPGRVQRGLARSFQITSVFREFTVLENVMLPVQARQGHSFRFWQSAKRDPSLTVPARVLLEEVGLGDRAAIRAGHLAHGEQRQLEIAIALATNPSFLLLDEPMAGMGPEENRALIDFLGRLKETHGMLLIEHDLDAVFALADRITVLVYGRVIASGRPAEIRQNRQVRTAYLGSGHV
jgi:branched-chain amino acid transport system ATP-binding protein